MYLPDKPLTFHDKVYWRVYNRAMIAFYASAYQRAGYDIVARIYLTESLTMREDFNVRQKLETLQTWVI